MAIAGRVAIVPKGDWSADVTYKRLDAVTYNNTLYFAKKDVPAGTATSNTEYWSKSIVGGASAIATTEDAGVVKPDGKSMSVDESGTLSINLDGTTITLDEAKNVIKLADTLKDKIGTALQPESIANNQTTTEAGFALDARQANPSVDGTLAKLLSDLSGSLEGVSRISTVYKLFANVPILNGIHCFCVSDGNNPITDSPYPNSNGWWNVICFGVGGGAPRMIQIASQAYKREFGFEGKNELWVRSLHDRDWSEWTKLLDLNNFRDISSNDDLNNVKFFNVGKYRCYLNMTAETVLNSPFKTAFTMEVYYSAGTSNYVAQKATEFATGHCKWRMRETASGNLQDWVQLY